MCRIGLMHGGTKLSPGPGEGLAGCFVRTITGSYTNVVGLPLTEVVSLLIGEGFPVHFNWLRAAEIDAE